MTAGRTAIPRYRRYICTFRAVLWRWMLIIYSYEEPEDLVLVVAFQDARSSAAAHRDMSSRTTAHHRDV
jgi:hypothetical protein